MLDWRGEAEHKVGPRQEEEERLADVGEGDRGGCKVGNGLGVALGVDDKVDGGGQSVDRISRSVRAEEREEPEEEGVDPLDAEGQFGSEEELSRETPRQRRFLGRGRE